MTSTAIARQRRHTLYFLEAVRAFAPVYLDTEIDMSRVAEHREAAREHGERVSVVSYVLYAAARALAAHPEANAAIRGRRRPRVARYREVNGKLTLDKTLDGHRVVLAVVLPALDRADLPAIQRLVDRYRDGDPATMPEFAGARALHRLPGPIGRALFRLGLSSLAKRPALLGTFAVTSLGHRPVDSFHSVGGTTVTLGVGRVRDRPVVREGRLAVAPVMRLSLAFDHRVIDGAEAADVLADIKTSLEAWTAPASAAPTAPTSAGRV